MKMLKKMLCTDCKKEFVVFGEKSTEGKRTWPVTCPYCGGPNEIDFPSFDGVFHVYPVQAGPGHVFSKENGKYSFFVSPDGVEKEAGEWEHRADAEVAADRNWQRWKTNLGAYGPLDVITDSFSVTGDPEALARELASRQARKKDENQ